MARLRAVKAWKNEEMAKDVHHTKHSAGRAVGFGECEQWLESLLTTAEQEPGEGTRPTGKEFRAASRDIDATTAATRGDLSYAELLSP